MTKMLVFDMDGTLGDFYNEPCWLDSLIREDPAPYDNARPIYDMVLLNGLISQLKNRCGYQIAVISWLSKGSSKQFSAVTRESKKAWLDKYSFPYDELHFIKYGATKANCTRKKGGIQILVDDDKAVRSGWTLGGVINANEKNLINELIRIYNEEMENEI